MKRKELDEKAVIDGLGVGVAAVEADTAALGCPDTHALGLQLGQRNPTGAEQIDIDAFLGHILLLPEKGPGPLNGDTPGFFFDHSNHLLSIIQQVAAKRKMKNY